MINFEIYDSEVFNQFNHLEEAAYHVPLDEIGQLLVQSVHANFDAQGRPTQWEGRQDDHPWPILIKTGALYNSIGYSVHGDGVSVDCGEPYGDYHDQGTSRIPARPFLLIQDEDANEIENMIWEHLWD